MGHWPEESLLHPDDQQQLAESAHAILGHFDFLCRVEDVHAFKNALEASLGWEPTDGRHTKRAPFGLQSQLPFQLTEQDTSFAMPRFQADTQLYQSFCQER